MTDRPAKRRAPLAALPPLRESPRPAPGATVRDAGRRLALLFGPDLLERLRRARANTEATPCTRS